MYSALASPSALRETYTASFGGISGQTSNRSLTKLRRTTFKKKDITRNMSRDTASREISINQVDEDSDSDGLSDHLIKSKKRVRIKAALSTVNRNQEEYLRNEGQEVADKEFYLKSLRHFIDPYEDVKRSINIHDE